MIALFKVVQPIKYYMYTREDDPPLMYSLCIDYKPYSSRNKTR